MPGAAANPELQARLRALAERREGQREMDLGILMNQPWGRRLYYWLVFELAGLEGHSYNLDIKDGACAAQHTYLHEGRRDIGRALAVEAQKLCPHQWVQMLSEQLAQRAADIAAQQKTTSAPDKDDES